MRAFLFMLSFLPLSLAAQNTSVSAAVPRLTFKTNAGILINPFKQAFAFTTDVRLTPKISVDAGAGAFLNSIIFADQKGESYTGLRLRAGVKYFLIRAERSGFHLGLEAKYHNIRNVKKQEIFRQGQQYLQIYPLERRVRTKGLALRTGWQLYLGTQKRWMLEPYAGLGVLFHEVNPGLPPDGMASDTDFRGMFSFEYKTGKSTTPDVLLGMHLGVVLW